jgi:glycosyltransferase involved in cell wall biosynthesis
VKIAFLTTDRRENFRDYSPPNSCFGTAPEALLQGLALRPDIEVHVISCLQQRVRTFEKIAENISYHGLLVPKFGWMRTGYQGCVRAVRRKLRDIQPDVVHGQGTERDCALSAVFSGFPNVITVHGNMRLIAKVNRARPLTFGWLAARLEEFTLPRSDGVVCITNYTREAVGSLARRTWVVPNAVDQTFFITTREPNEKHVALCVGNISYRKNQLKLIEALDPIASKLALEVVFLGVADDGDPYARDFKLCLQSRPWCVFRGFADRESLKAYLRSASLLVLPSIEDNCPMVVLEAMAAGVPVVAPNVGGVPELVDDGQTGLLCDPFDAASIRAAILRLLTQPDSASALARRAKVTALARFHPLRIAEQHIQIYQQIADLRAHARPGSASAVFSRLQSP